jgi:hypothetical protein
MVDKDINNSEMKIILESGYLYSLDIKRKIDES